MLTATNETQGRRANDFCWTVEGELVCFPPIECSCGTIDDGCGCHRGMAGLASHRATTTMKVIERPDLDPKTYSALISDGYQKQGYLNEDLLADAEVRAWLRDAIDELIQLADPWPVGTVLERRGDVIRLRSRTENSS